MSTDSAVMLAKYNAWADRVLFEAIKTLPVGAIYESTKSIFGSMIGTLNHNFQVDLIWRAHLLGEKHGFSTRRDLLHPRLESLVDAQCSINQWYVDWAKSQTPDTLSSSLSFKYVSGKSGEMTRGGIFLHVVNHKTYHRGWIAERFFDHGAKPPETDLCVFLTEQ